MWGKKHRSGVLRFFRHGACWSGDPITVLFRTQPEHAIRESCPAGTAQDQRGPNDAKPPSKVSMTADKDCRDFEAEA
jgi:hypothetical protein